MSSTSPRQGLSKTLQSAKTRIIAGLAFLLLTAVISASALAANNDQSYVGQITASISSFFGLSAGSQTSVLPQPSEVSPGDQAGDVATGCDSAPEGLIACYKADASAEDARGAHNGTWVGAAGYTQGKVGQGSFSFNGKSHVEVPNDQELNPAKLTVSGWVDVSGTEGTFSLMSKGGNYSLQVKDGMVVFTSRDAKGVIGTLETPVTGQPGTWMHIAATHDGATRTLYINGEEAVTDKQAGLFRKDVSSLVIGLVNTEDANFTAQADEVMLFGRALSAKEIGTLAQRTPNTITNANFTVTPSTVVEGNAGQQSLLVSVTRTFVVGDGSNLNQINVNFSATDQTATGGANCGVAGVDYAFGTPSVNFLANESGTKTVNLFVCGDTLAWRMQ